MTTPTKIVLVLFAGLLIVAAVIASKSPNPLDTPSTGNAPFYANSSSTAANTASTSTNGTPSSLPVLADAMPPFTGITQWYNTANGQPLTPADLKGKVVLVDFWTYSCINCIRTYPFLKTMYARYADQGLVIVGVHTPEFAFEADPKNVGQAIKDNDITWPIALDANYGTWNAYGNQYWPAEYLFDRQGRLRATHFGEGDYDTSEANIRSLLAEAPGVSLMPNPTAVPTPNLNGIGTQETYFGLERGDAFMGTAGADGVAQNFTASKTVSPDKWTIGGNWTFGSQYDTSNAAGNTFSFNVQADSLHLVLQSTDGKDKTLEVMVDGKPAGTITVNQPMLYTPATFPNGGRHTVTITIEDPGVEFYSATFS